MIVLGGLLEVSPVVSDKGVEKALFKTLPERHHHLIPLNMEAIKAGREIIENI
jgi:2-oxoglutarate ferredoxin oxidoreductase subunit gamma